jgi:glycine cleavage system H lipoate-binding protein/TusA-related sulfurtransferase
MNLMKIDNCIFPEGLLYDIENFVWVDVKATKVVTIGITTLLSSISGRLSTIKLKEVGTEIEKGKGLATIESNKYFGVVRAPLTGRIIEVNEFIRRKPKLVNEFPYSYGWFVKMEPLSINKYPVNLQPIENCHDKVKSLINDLHIRCFVAYPDYEMYEIGVECAATLTKLDELISKIEIGEIVHLVSDDKTADLEMIRWSQESGQSILETRPEENLLHFIVKKVK